MLCFKSQLLQLLRPLRVRLFPIDALLYRHFVKFYRINLVEGIWDIVILVKILDFVGSVQRKVGFKNPYHFS